MKFFFKTLSAHRFLKVELSPQFRKFLNVWHIQNLEQPFLICACNCLVKFWRSPKNFKIQKFLWKLCNHLSKKNFPQKFWILKFFGLRQNLTRQLQTQIKKGCSKFWILEWSLFKNWVKNIQAAAYNGVHTVYTKINFWEVKQLFWPMIINQKFNLFVKIHFWPVHRYGI